MARSFIRSRSNSPEDVELFLEVSEVLDAGGEGGFALEGEGGGQTVGVREFMLGAKFGGGARQFEVGSHESQIETWLTVRSIVRHPDGERDAWWDQRRWAPRRERGKVKSAR